MGAEEVGRCSRTGAKMQKCRSGGAEVCRGTCAWIGAEEQRCSVQRSRGSGAKRQKYRVQRWRGAGAGAEVMQRCRGAEVQKGR